MLTKTLNGELTTMTYNAANQLVTSTTGSSDPLTYSYDDAGRLLGSGGALISTYGWLDKITTAQQANGSTLTYQYWPNGHIASITSKGAPSLAPTEPSSTSPSTALSSETFLWDGLALIKRNDTLYLIEPHPSGGIPIASHPVGEPEMITYHLNDLLGTTLATVGPEGIRFSNLTSFGQPLKSPSNAAPLAIEAPAPPASPIPTTNSLSPSRH